MTVCQAKILGFYHIVALIQVVDLVPLQIRSIILGFHATVEINLFLWQLLRPALSGVIKSSNPCGSFRSLFVEFFGSIAKGEPYSKVYHVVECSRVL